MELYSVILVSLFGTMAVCFEDPPSIHWEKFDTSFYLFILDVDREVDNTWNEAAAHCQSMDASLVSINNAKELDFVQRKIKKLVKMQGEKFGQEDWWTSGRLEGEHWFWHEPQAESSIKIEVEGLALPHEDDYAEGFSHRTHYLALAHDSSGWYLKAVPRTFRLRYICEKRAEVTDKFQPSEDRLIKYLFREYEPDARGNADPNATVNVRINFFLLRIQNLDQHNQAITSTGLLVADWLDARLLWVPAQFNNLSSVVVRANRVWLPELAVINGAEEQMIKEFENIRVRIHSTGRVHWEPGGNFVTVCDIDVTFFPFDQQACAIHIGAWAYETNKMNLTNMSTYIETSSYTVNGEWDLMSTKAEWREIVLPCCPEMRYPYLAFTVFINRRHTFYLINIVLPCFLLSLLILAVFWIPPDAGEKLSAGISIMLAYTVFLLMLANTIPRTSLSVPILAVYITCTMSLGAISVCFSVIVLVVHHKRYKPVPKWAKVLVLKCMATCLKMEPPWQVKTNPTTYNSPNKSKWAKMEEKKMLQREENNIENEDLKVQTYWTEYDSATCDSKSHDQPRKLNDNTEKCEKHKHKRIPSDCSEDKMSNYRRDSFTCTEHTSKLTVWRKEWIFLAMVLDRFFFFVISVLMILNIVTVLCLPLYRT